jgi:RNA polymerase sigma-70 factor (ECF subfamily)
MLDDRHDPPDPEPPGDDVLDAELLRRARGGDRAALGRLLEGVGPMLLRQARGALDQRLRARMGASDLVQSSLLEAARDFGSFAGRTAAELRGWLRGILRRNLLDEAKAQGRARRAVGLERPIAGSGSNGGLELPADVTSATRHIARRQVLEQVRALLGELPEAQRRAVELWADGHPVREIARRLDRTELAVASLLKRAFGDLRRRMGKLGDGTSPR